MQCVSAQRVVLPVIDKFTCSIFTNLCYFLACDTLTPGYKGLQMLLPSPETDVHKVLDVTRVSVGLRLLSLVL